MSIPVRRGRQVLRQHGLRRFMYRFLSHVGVPVWNTVTSRRPVGTNVFERDWDVLVVLDACRVDALREFRSTFSWLDSVGTLRSVGSMSAEWTLNTFTERYIEEIGRTALISRNVWSNRILVDRLHAHRDNSEEDGYGKIRRGFPDWQPVTVDTFGHYERVIAKDNQDQRLHPESSSIPQVVTDRAIHVGRTKDIDRLVVWYRMPHLNFFADAVDWSPDTSSETLMAGLESTRSLRPEEKSYEPGRKGEVSPQTVRNFYLENLHLVLSYVDVLLRNIDAEDVVVSADHGEGLGDKIWSHPYGYPWPPVRTVPWAQTTATDEGTYISQYDELNRDPLPEERKEILKEMGYI